MIFFSNNMVSTSIHIVAMMNSLVRARFWNFISPQTKYILLLPVHASIFCIVFLVCSQEKDPELWQHFRKMGVETHMFAHHWFLTLCTARFPLYFVFSILDIVLVQGLDTIFQIALALLTVSERRFDVVIVIYCIIMTMNEVWALTFIRKHNSE